MRSVEKNGMRKGVSVADLVKVGFVVVTCELNGTQRLYSSYFR